MNFTLRVLCEKLCDLCGKNLLTAKDTEVIAKSAKKKKAALSYYFTLGNFQAAFSRFNQYR